MIPSINERRYGIYKNINVQQVQNKYEENVGCTRKRPTPLRRTTSRRADQTMIGMKSEDDCTEEVSVNNC